MFSGVVETLLRGAGASALTEIFIGLMFVVFVCALIFHKLGFWRPFTVYTATLLTSLGILGTFAGVVTGLLDFDSSVDKIDQSIGLLLQGLKTAFISSLVGMTLSIAYKVIVLLPGMQPSYKNIQQDGVSIDDLYALEERQLDVLGKISTAIGSKNESSILSQLNFLKQSHVESRRQGESALSLAAKTLSVLSDDGESSLTGQLKLVRGDANDVGKSLSNHLETAVSSLRNIADQAEDWRLDQKSLLEASFQQLQATRSDYANYSKQANAHLAGMLTLLEKSPTETLIAALEDVIRDFNKHISEQFGENFKELNDAVGRMVEWQENYRHQLTELRTSFDMSVRAIGNCETSITAIDKSAESIPGYMSSLSDILSVSQNQLNNLESHMEAFAGVRDRAVESIPVIHKVIEDGVSGVRDASQLMARGIGSSSCLLYTSPSPRD